MKHLLAPLSVLLFLLPAGPAPAADTTPAFPLKEVLQPGPVDLQVMASKLSDRGVQLSEKLNAALLENRDWFLEYSKKAAPGKPLPYDKRLGLTADEYDEYLAEAKKRTLVPTGEVIKANFVVENGVFRVDLGDNTTPLSELRINLETTGLTASVGEVGQAVWKTSDRTDIPVGPWEGYIWNYQAGNLEAYNIRVLSLEILRRKENGHILWNFKDGETVHKQLTREFEVMLEYAPPGK